MAQLSQTLTIPAEVSQLAATYRVGTPLKRYRPFSMARMVFAILCLAFAVPCIIAVGIAGISSEVTIVFGGIALLLVVLGLLLLFVRTKRGQPHSISVQMESSLCGKDKQRLYGGIRSCLSYGNTLPTATGIITSCLIV